MSDTVRPNFGESQPDLIGLGLVGIDDIGRAAEAYHAAQVPTPYIEPRSHSNVPRAFRNVAFAAGVAITAPLAVETYQNMTANPNSQRSGSSVLVLGEQEAQELNLTGVIENIVARDVVTSPLGSGAFNASITQAEVSAHYRANPEKAPQTTNSLVEYLSANPDKLTKTIEAAQDNARFLDKAFADRDINPLVQFENLKESTLSESVTLVNSYYDRDGNIAEQWQETFEAGTHVFAYELDQDLMFVRGDGEIIQFTQADLADSIVVEQDGKILVVEFKNPCLNELDRFRVIVVPPTIKERPTTTTEAPTTTTEAPTTTTSSTTTTAPTTTTSTIPTTTSTSTSTSTSTTIPTTTSTSTTIPEVTTTSTSTTLPETTTTSTTLPEVTTTSTSTTLPETTTSTSTTIPETTTTSTTIPRTTLPPPTTTTIPEVTTTSSSIPETTVTTGTTLPVTTVVSTSVPPSTQPPRPGNTLPSSSIPETTVTTGTTLPVTTVVSTSVPPSTQPPRPISYQGEAVPDNEILVPATVAAGLAYLGLRTHLALARQRLVVNESK
jgi:hypothetical protein